MNLRPCSDITASTAKISWKAPLGGKSFLGRANKFTLWAMEVSTIRKTWFKKFPGIRSKFLYSDTVSGGTLGTVHPRGCWMIYRGAGFPLYAPPSPSPVSKLSPLPQSSCVSPPVELTDRKGGKMDCVGEERNHARESLVLCKSLNTLVFVAPRDWDPP